MRLAVVIVTFNNELILQKHLSSLSKQSRKPDGIIIVNTGRGNIPKFPGLNLSIIDSGDIGPAGGFKEGAKKAYADGYDYIVFADDDAIPGKDTIRYLSDHAELAVAGNYKDGRVAGLNHYAMFHRSVFARIGFYVEDLFYGLEDREFKERMEPIVSMTYDPRIIIDHPDRPHMDSHRMYLFARNAFALGAIRGKSSRQARNFVYYLIHACITFAFAKDPIFLIAFWNALKDFFSGKLGPPTMRRWDLELKELGKLQGKTIVICHGPGPHDIQDRFEEIIPKHETFISRIIRKATRSIGKNLIINDMITPPFTLSAKNVYVYDEATGRLYLFFRNNPVWALLFAMVFIPLCSVILLFFLIGNLLKRGYYQRLSERKIRQDLEFCKDFNPGC